MENLVYKRLYGITNIPMCIVEDEKVTLRIPDLEMEFFTDRFVEICLWDMRMQKLPRGIPIVHYLEPGFFLGIYQCSEKKCMIFGPAVPCRYSWKDIEPWLDSSLYEDNSAAAGRLLMSMELVSEKKFINAFCLGIYLYCGINIKPKEIYMKQPIYFQRKMHPSLASYIVDSRESSGFHTPQLYEEQLTDAIKHGNREMLNDLLHQTVVGRMGILSPDFVRQERYMFVTIASVAARAAMSGGLNYETACSLADIYCQRMDSMSELKHLDALVHQMFFDFCEHVSSEKQKGYSIPVQICRDYIQKHTHQKILLRNLAEECGYSERRLSQKFYEETGVRIVDYIHQEKMNEAALLLKNSNYTLNEIGEYLGYGSQSYFTAKFKAVYGKTPFEFRQDFGKRNK